jgi:hypothetical protein
MITGYYSEHGSHLVGSRFRTFVWVVLMCVEYFLEDYLLRRTGGDNREIIVYIAS